jgi:hypothetical protein
VRQVLFLGDNTMTSGLELAAVRCVFERAGIQVHDLQASEASFRAAYQDDENDVIWVGSHGEFEHLAPDASRLVLGEDETLDVSSLASLEVPSGDRRLMVLNVCDGAVSATLGGPAGLGIGPAIAGSSQSVVSNLWPVNPLVASTFGAILAAAIASGLGHQAAFQEAVQQLRGGRQGIQDALERLGECGAELAERVRNQESVDFDGMAAWGAPALLV